MIIIIIQSPLRRHFSKKIKNRMIITYKTNNNLKQAWTIQIVKNQIHQKVLVSIHKQVCIIKEIIMKLQQQQPYYNKLMQSIWKKTIVVQTIFRPQNLKAVWPALLEPMWEIWFTKTIRKTWSKSNKLEDR